MKEEASKTYSYAYTYKILKRLMVDSGIKYFCQKVCKGACCERCDRCSKSKIPQPIECLAYICFPLSGLIKEDRFNVIFSGIKIAMSNRVNERNLFFGSKIPEKTRKKIRFEDYIIRNIRFIDPSETRNKLRNFRDLQAKFRTDN